MLRMNSVIPAITVSMASMSVSVGGPETTKYEPLNGTPKNHHRGEAPFQSHMAW